MSQSDNTINKEKIKNLIIDFGGVIINLARNRCIEAFERLGVDVHEKLTNNYQHKDLFMQLELGNISPELFHDGIRQLAGHIITDQQIDDAWILMLDDVPSQKLDLLLDLQKRYNTLLLSNTNIIHWEWSIQNVFSYQNHQLSDYFHRIYLSYELNMLKPDAEIFQYVLDDASILPEETLLIDDALVNCKAAEALGIQTYMPEPREDWSFLFSSI